jgi:hopanoid biosynthesis associated radical SAM protein HpnH
VIAPHKRLTINVHLDGMQQTHDYVTDRDGVFDKAVAMMREAKRRGYHVITNTTVFKETSIDEVEALFSFLRDDVGVDGMLISPGYQYELVERDVFPTRDDIETKFGKVLQWARDFPLQSTPMFLEFAAGLRDYRCSPWSTVTFTPNGWKGPCYLIGKQHTFDWKTFWEGTDWDYWESRQDRRCQNCKMHSGFEASVVKNLPSSPGDLLRILAWNFGLDRGLFPSRQRRRRGGRPTSPSPRGGRHRRKTLPIVQTPEPDPGGVV